MGFLQPVFWVVILLGIMILIHELGHFWAALAVGVKVETFSIGFGPRLFGFKRGETDFRVSAIPFGGYVRMLGEQPGQSVVLQAAELDRQRDAAEQDNAPDPGAFYAKPRWQRASCRCKGGCGVVLMRVCSVSGRSRQASVLFFKT